MHAWCRDGQTNGRSGMCVQGEGAEQGHGIKRTVAVTSQGAIAFAAAPCRVSMSACFIILQSDAHNLAGQAVILANDWVTLSLESRARHEEQVYKDV